MTISCKDEVSRSLKSKPSALSKLNDVIIVTDDDMWDSEVGDTIKYYFASAYPILPRPEPFFDLRHFSVADLNSQPLRKELRTYVVAVDLSDDDSDVNKMFKRDIGEERYMKAKTDPNFNSSVGRDKWARGQLIVYLFANSEEALFEVIQNNFSAVAKRIHMHDEKALHSKVYSQKENLGLSQKLKDRYDVDLLVPGDYLLAKEDEKDGMIWLRKNMKEGGAMNLVFRQMDYTDESQLGMASAKALRDDYGLKHVESDVPGSHMLTNDVDLPMYEYTREINGEYAKEYRGIWEMSKDFIGGSFATYLILDKETNKLLFVDAWVFAPGKSKRDIMQEMEHLVNQIKFSVNG